MIDPAPTAPAVAPAPAASQPNPLDAVVFDLGNVLIEWDPLRAVAAGVGQDRADRFMQEFDFPAWNHAQDSGRSFADGEAAALQTHPQFREELLAYRTNFAESLVGPVAGTAEILRELHAGGVPLIALTNWSQELFPVAEATFDFLELFEDIVISGEEEVAKPDPEIFEILEERIRHLGSLDDSIFIDDSPVNVQAAGEAGLDAILFTGASDLRLDLLVRGLPVAER